MEAQYKKKLHYKERRGLKMNLHIIIFKILLNFKLTKRDIMTMYLYKIDNTFRDITSYTAGDFQSK